MIRVGLWTLGTIAGLYGVWLLLTRQDTAQLTNAGVWLVSGVVLHDFVLAPLVLLVVAVLTRLLPGAAQRPTVAVLVVVGTVSLMALPILGQFGAHGDNPTLLNHNYLVGWLVLALLVVVGAVLTEVTRGRRHRTRTRPSGG